MSVSQLQRFSYFIHKGPHSVVIVFQQKAAVQRINVMPLIKSEFLWNKFLDFKTNSSINYSFIYESDKEVGSITLHWKDDN